MWTDRAELWAWDGLSDGQGRDLQQVAEGKNTRRLSMTAHVRLECNRPDSQYKPRPRDAVHQWQIPGCKKDKEIRWG